MYKFEKKFSFTSRNPKKRSQKSSGNVINNKYTACDYQKKSENQADTRGKRKRGKINLNLTRTTNIIEKNKSKKQSLNITTTLPKKRKHGKAAVIDRQVTNLDPVSANNVKTKVSKDLLLVIKGIQFQTLLFETEQL